MEFRFPWHHRDSDCLGIVVLWTVREPKKELNTDAHVFQVTRIQLFDRTYVAAVAEFFHRNGLRLALGLLLFIFIFTLGEAF